MAAALFYVPLFVPIVPALVKNINLLSLWNTPALNLLPVMLLGSRLVTVPRVAVLRIAGVITLLTLLIVAASPFVAFALLKTGVENDAAYARLLMEATEREWHKDTDKPLKLIGGPFALVSTAAFYGKDRPSTYPQFSRYLAPWVDDNRIARDGMAIMCSDWALCLQYMDAVAARYGGGRRAGRSARGAGARRAGGGGGEGGPSHQAPVFRRQRNERADSSAGRGRGAVDSHAADWRAADPVRVRRRDGWKCASAGGMGSVPHAAAD